MTEYRLQCGICHFLSKYDGKKIRIFIHIMHKYAYWLRPASVGQPARLRTAASASVASAHGPDTSAMTDCPRSRSVISQMGA